MTARKKCRAEHPEHGRCNWPEPHNGPMHVTRGTASSVVWCDPEFDRGDGVPRDDPQGTGVSLRDEDTE